MRGWTEHERSRLLVLAKACKTAHRTTCMADTLASLTAALTDRYRIQREIGQGGMATVFLARDTKHDRPVALKVLRPELGAVLGVERFLS